MESAATGGSRHRCERRPTAPGRERTGGTGPCLCQNGSPHGGRSSAWLERQVVALKAGGSSPLAHPNAVGWVRRSMRRTLRPRIAPLAQRQSNGLLIRRFWVRNPGGAHRPQVDAGDVDLARSIPARRPSRGPSRRIRRNDIPDRNPGRSGSRRQPVLPMCPDKSFHGDVTGEDIAADAGDRRSRL